MEEKYFGGRDYKNPKTFDVKQYMKLFTRDESSNEFPFMTKASVDTIHAIFQKDKPPGPHQLDLACGPSIHTLLSSTKYCTDIVCAEYSPQLRDEIQKWLDSDSGAFDWSGFFKYVADLENSDATTIEKRVRSSIKKLIPCDLLDDKILGYDASCQFDVITASLCMEVTCPDILTYKKVMQKVFDMLAPGGIFVYMGVLENKWYKIGGHKFYNLYIKEEDVQNALVEAGFSKEPEWKMIPIVEAYRINCAKSYFCLHVRKPDM